jgi:hypothetical protein
LQSGGESRLGIYFSTDETVDRVHASVDRSSALSPPWTDGSADRGGAGARRRPHRSSASGRSGAPKLTGRSATEREECTGSSARASPGLGRRRGGRATGVQNRRRRRLVGGRLERGERRREAGRGVVNSGGGARLL